jgi:ribose 5-phosphate isomerase RpiB
VSDGYTAHDDLNVLCLGSRVIGPELARELVRTFAAARFSGAERHLRRLAEVAEIESDNVAHTQAAAKEIEARWPFPIP